MIDRFPELGQKVSQVPIAVDRSRRWGDRLWKKACDYEQASRWTCALELFAPELHAHPMSRSCLFHCHSASVDQSSREEGWAEHL